MAHCRNTIYPTDNAREIRESFEACIVQPRWVGEGRNKHNDHSNDYKKPEVEPSEDLMEEAQNLFKGI